MTVSISFRERLVEAQIQRSLLRDSAQWNPPQAKASASAHAHVSVPGGHAAYERMNNFEHVVRRTMDENRHRR
jgi:hypothetical protein